MTTEDFIISLFCVVGDEVGNIFVISRDLRTRVGSCGVSIKPGLAAFFCK